MSVIESPFTVIDANRSGNILFTIERDAQEKYHIGLERIQIAANVRSTEPTSARRGGKPKQQQLRTLAMTLIARRGNTEGSKMKFLSPRLVTYVAIASITCLLSTSAVIAVAEDAIANPNTDPNAEILDQGFESRNYGGKKGHHHHYKKKKYHNKPKHRKSQF
ncbi:hypothetical protein BGZ93_009143 [Podila epicladia]|nr:hypothetical protein BGZ93_009143 [Podila epicladia]